MHQALLLLNQIPVYLLCCTDTFHCYDVTHLVALSWCQLFGSVERFHWERSKPRVEWDYPLLCKQEPRHHLPRMSQVLKCSVILVELKKEINNENENENLTPKKQVLQKLLFENYEN